jgi:hypothetical protein
MSVATFTAEDVDIDVDMSDTSEPWVQVTLGDTNEQAPSASLLLSAAEARQQGVELIVAADRAEQRIIQLEQVAEDAASWAAPASTLDTETKD